MMKNYLTKTMVLSAFSLMFALSVNASEALVNTPTKLKVVTTLPVIKAIAKEIGGGHIEVNSLLSATEDPHSVRDRPTLLHLVKEADLFLQIGRDLEVKQLGKLSKLVVNVSDGFKALEIPLKRSRENGDIHPKGNPHIWLCPLGGLKMAENIKAAFIAADVGHKDAYEKNFVLFKNKLSEALFGKELISSVDSVDLWRLHEGKRT